MRSSSHIKAAAFVLVIILSIAMVLLIPVHQPAFPATNWQKVYNNSDTTIVNDMAQYNSQLYIALGGGDTLYARVKRYNGGTIWSQINTSGFGDDNNLNALSLVNFNDTLYCGTANPITGAEIWAYKGSTWSQVNTDGFGDNQLRDCNKLCVYNNALYAGVHSAYDGCRIFRYNGGTSWTQVNTQGFGDINNNQILSMISWNGSLWCGTENASSGAEVWRYNDSTSTWTQANADKFDIGSSMTSALSLQSYNGQLYCGTGSNMARLFVYNGDTSWSQVGSTGFGNPNNYGVKSLSVCGPNLFIGTDRRNADGCQVLSFNGSSIIQENQNGFGDTNNIDATVMAVFNSNLYVGTKNFNGTQIWRSVPPPKPYTVYLAEGSTAWGFDCYISIENPQTFPVTVALTYQTNTGPVAGPQFVMAAKSQATINPRDTLGNQDFSTKIKCLDGKLIAADRTMIWNRCGEEGHNSIGVTAPAKTWYLAEGSSEWGFECWLLIQNPNASEASCNVTYMIEGRGPVTVNKKVPANSRKTFFMADDIGSADASIKVVSNLPVIPERAMYRNNRREGHDSIGTTTPAQDYYLAEGTSAWGFTTYVLVQNPNNSVTSVTVTYMTKDGPVGQAPFNMPPNSRKTIRVNDVLPNVDFSTKVHGNQPIIAERAMYWNNGTGEACHDSIGMASAHKTFYLPDGQTSEGRETWTLVQNPNSSLVEVEISYLTPDGAGNVVFTDTIPANSRRTYNMADKGIGGRAAVMVKSLTSGKKIMVERAMYWNSRGAGTDTIGGFSDN